MNFFTKIGELFSSAKYMDIIFEGFKTTLIISVFAALLGLLLGVIVVLGLALHLSHFWAKMMLQELMGVHNVVLADGSVVSPTNGAAIIQYTFSQWYNVVLYLVWFVALWLHLNHGVWSMFQTAGMANDTWLPRLKLVSKLLSTVIFLGFSVVVVWFYVEHLLATCPCFAQLFDFCK